MRPIIYPYKFGSTSARALSNELHSRNHRAKRVRADGNYRPYRNHLIINWGNSNPPMWPRTVNYGEYPDLWLNSVPCVGRTSNKLTAFQIMKEEGVSVPDFTTEVAVAREWVDDGMWAVARTLTRGSAGRGIEMCTQENIVQYGVRSLPTAPLYVKYIKKAEEYRIHVFKGEVIDIQHKRKRRDTANEDVNYQVRSHDNGWIFARDAIVQPSRSVLDESINAVNALGLDFGAVDVIWNNHHQRAYVLEVNTAPGLEGTTVVKYADAIERLL